MLNTKQREAIVKLLNTAKGDLAIADREYNTNERLARSLESEIHAKRISGGLASADYVTAMSYDSLDIKSIDFLIEIEPLEAELGDAIRKYNHADAVRIEKAKRIKYFEGIWATHAH